MPDLKNSKSKKSPAKAPAKSAARSAASNGHGAIPDDDLLALHRNMLVTRRLDEKMMILLKQGKSFFHIGASGHEATQVAAAYAMRGGIDWSYPYYRDLAYCVQLGMTLLEVMLCFLLEGGGSQPGRPPDAGTLRSQGRIVSQSSPTGTQYLQAVGTALAIKKEGIDEVVYVSSGEGTTSQGDFHEAINWAAREKLPVIFHIEDNKYAISVPIHQQTAGGSVYQMVGGYAGLGRAEFDGTDLFASYAAWQRAIERARRGEGPSVLVSDCVRLLPHSSSDNQAKYRKPEELEADKKRDPIPRLEEELVARGLVTREELEEIREAVHDEVDQAADEAEARPFPDGSTALHHVYSTLQYQAPAGASVTPSEPGQSCVLVDAINHALHEEMDRNPKIVVYGEDIEDKKGGVFTATTGLSTKFGTERVWNSPLAESSIVGTAIGMAIKGWKPVVEIQFGDYVWTAMMQIRDELATMRYRSDGNWSCPLVVRIPVGGYIHGALYHSQNIEATFAHFPGLYVAYPSNAGDAKGLLKSAIRGDDPYLFLEQKGLYRQAYATSPEPSADFLLPWGVARVAREGKDLTIVSYGALVKKSLDAAEKLSERGVSVEVIDIRTMVPFDLETVVTSIKKTGRVLIAHEDVVFAGFGAEIAAQIADAAFQYLDAPVKRVGGAESPIPYNWFLEANVLPQDHHVLRAAEELANY
ncbi:MAG: thiamine pyrophosphate-dependent enzyme [Candidatus Eisenbacteria bacterium]